MCNNNNYNLYKYINKNHWNNFSIVTNQYMVDKYIILLHAILILTNLSISSIRIINNSSSSKNNNSPQFIYLYDLFKNSMSR